MCCLVGLSPAAGASAPIADAELLVTRDGSDFSETVLVRWVLEQQTAANVFSYFANVRNVQEPCHYQQQALERKVVHAFLPSPFLPVRWWDSHHGLGLKALQSLAGVFPGGHVADKALS